uniref:Uncharacterized protein n=1 Tax=Ixodes ricinus TaxID=34613 RepID=A0A6B0U1D5_IXORI
MLFNQTGNFHHQFSNILSWTCLSTARRCEYLISSGRLDSKLVVTTFSSSGLVHRFSWSHQSICCEIDKTPSHRLSDIPPWHTSLLCYSRF